MKPKMTIKSYAAVALVGSISLKHGSVSNQLRKRRMAEMMVRRKTLPSWKIHMGDSLEVLRTLENESVNCIVTSPPYWMLRDYEVDGQIGLAEKNIREAARQLPLDGIER